MNIQQIQEQYGVSLRVAGFAFRIHNQIEDLTSISRYAKMSQSEYIITNEVLTLLEEEDAQDV
jgi:hypothetical protein